MELKDLVGMKVKKAMMQGGDILLETPEGTIRLFPEGDCCASCYITDIDGSEALKNSTIKEVEDLVRPALPDNEKTDEVSDVWGHRIHTTKGIVTIGMRVDHNGYYGGSLYVSKEKGELRMDTVKDLEDFA